MTYIIELKSKNKYRVADDFAKQIKTKWVYWRELSDGDRVKKNSVLDLETYVGSLSDIKSIYKDPDVEIKYNEEQMKQAEQENQEWKDPVNVERRKKAFEEMRKWFDEKGTFEHD